jgi:hypothetical protein
VLARSGGDFCEAEVEELGLSAFGDKNIGRLDIAMNDAFAVGGVEGVGDLDAQRDQGFGVERAAFDAMLQGLAFEELDRDEGQAVLLVDLVNGADIGMVESGGGLSFALKAAEGLMIFGHVVGEEFEGNKAAES